MRFAKQVFNAYVSNPNLQDLIETSVGAGVTAGGQAMFTDMTPQEIAISAGLGFGAATAARPIGARVGARVGKYLDKTNPNFIEEFIDGNPFGEFLATSTPGSPRAIMEIKKMIRDLPDGKQKEIMKTALKSHVAKYKQNFKGRGPLEGTGTFLGRYYGDNLAQAGVGIATPLILGNVQEEV